MIEITRHDPVTRIKMSREFNGQPVYWMAAYLVDGLLVDTGCHATAGELVSFLEGEPFNRVVNTHYHEDHIGGNHDILSRFGIEIVAHPRSIAKISEVNPLYPYQEFAFGYPVPTEVKPVPEMIETGRFTFRVIETPGHCEGHICIVELKQGWCFTGDLFARETPKFIRAEENICEIIESMRKIIALPTDRLVLFTSLGRVAEDGRKALTDCIGYLEGLSARCKTMSRSGATVDGIVMDLFGGEHPFRELTDGQFSTANLVRSLLETT